MLLILSFSCLSSFIVLTSCAFSFYTVHCTASYEIIAPLQYNRTINGYFFETCFEKYLLTDVPKNGVVILDDASFMIVAYKIEEV